MTIVATQDHMRDTIDSFQLDTNSVCYCDHIFQTAASTDRMANQQTPFILSS